MTATFDKLKAQLETKGTLSNEEVSAAETELGALTDEEKFWLEAEKLKKARSSDASISLEQYLEASKLLDTLTEGSDDYNKTLAIVEKYESGM